MAKASVSVKRELRTHRADVISANEEAMGDRDGMDGAVNFATPEIEKALEAWERGCQVVMLPYEGLEEPGMIGETVENIGGG